jgi:hypothetical protein
MLKIADFVIACVARKISGCGNSQKPVLPPIRKLQVAHFKLLVERFNRGTVD